MSATKITTGLIVFARNEATYGAGSALTGSTDTVSLFQEFPQFSYQYAFDGSRQGASYTGGTIKRTAPSGRTTQGVIRVEGKGLGSAYSATATPPSLHALLKASGLSGSLSASAWVYSPAPLGQANPSASLAMNVYDRGEMLPVSGAYANLMIKGESAAPSMFEFDIQGLAGAISDVSSPPSRTYIAKDVVPPKNESIGLTIGAVSSLKVRSYSYEHGLEIVPRVDVNNSAGHAGFAWGRRTPVFTVTVESEALTTYDPYADFAAGTERAVSFTVGSSANNRFTVTFPQAQLTNVEKSEDGPVATWTLTFSPNVSGPDLSDDMSIRFN